MSEFEGKVVIVTGAGGGLGKQHALEFARRGAQVVVNDLGGSHAGGGASDMADAVVAQIKSEGGIAIANKASVADKAGAKSIVDDAVAEFGTLDILVNNAGILRDKSFKKMTLDDWDIVMDVHLNGTGYVTHAAWPIMCEKQYGRIVMTSSTSGIYGNFGQANYGAAKTGMLGLINVLAIEGASKNITVNGLVPSAETRLIGSVPGRDVDPDNPRPELHPKLVTPAAVYLCSEGAPTGKIISAGGGHFSTCAIFSNEGISLGVDATYEDLLQKADTMLDMGDAQEGLELWRRRFAEQ